MLAEPGPALCCVSHVIVTARVSQAWPGSRHGPRARPWANPAKKGPRSRPLPPRPRRIPPTRETPAASPSRRGPGAAVQVSSLPAFRVGASRGLRAEPAVALLPLRAGGLAAAWRPNPFKFQVPRRQRFLGWTRKILGSGGLSLKTEARPPGHGMACMISFPFFGAWRGGRGGEGPGGEEASKYAYSGCGGDPWRQARQPGQQGQCSLAASHTICLTLPLVL